MSIATEKHYTVAEIAKLWAKSEDTVRRALKGVPGVLRTVSQTRGKRKYATLSVPESVLNLLHAQPLKTRSTKDDNKPLPPGQGRRLKGGVITAKSIDDHWDSL